MGHAEWDERKTLVHVLLTSSITGRSLREREASVGDVLSLTHLHILVFLVLHYKTKLWPGKVWSDQILVQQHAGTLVQTTQQIRRVSITIRGTLLVCVAIVYILQWHLWDSIMYRITELAHSVCGATTICTCWPPNASILTIKHSLYAIF